VDFLDHETAKIDRLIARQERLIELLKTRAYAERKSVSQMVLTALEWYFSQQAKAQAQGGGSPAQAQAEGGAEGRTRGGKPKPTSGAKGRRRKAAA